MAGPSLALASRRVVSADRRVPVQDATFSITPGSLTFIVGPVACDKSTQLHAMLDNIAFVSSKSIVFEVAFATSFSVSRPFDQISQTNVIDLAIRTRSVSKV
jgi:ABC-type iron transport system FetAB ATPase subunit